MILHAQIMLELISFFNCSTFYSDGQLLNRDSAVPKASVQVASSYPWKLLEQTKLAPKNNKCAILILDDPTDYAKALPFLNRTRLDVSVALVAQNDSKLEAIKNGPVGHELVVVTVQESNPMTENENRFTLSTVNQSGKANKRHLVVSYVISLPYVTRAGATPKGSDVDILESLSSRLGFTTLYKRGQSFNDIISHVADGSSDMSISHTGIMWQRYRLGIAPIVLTPSLLRFMQRHPVPVSSLYTISFPFTQHVWVALVFTVIFTFLFLAFLNW